MKYNALPFKQQQLLLLVFLIIAGSAFFIGSTRVTAVTQTGQNISAVTQLMANKITPADRLAAAARATVNAQKIQQTAKPTVILGIASLLYTPSSSIQSTAPSSPPMPVLLTLPSMNPGGTPDYFGTTPNYANSPIIRKFVDSLPGLGAANANNLGQYIPVAVADTTSFLADPTTTPATPAADYYEIGVVQYLEKLHSDLPPTLLRGYVQVETPAIASSSRHIPLVNIMFDANGNQISMPVMHNGIQVLAVDNPHYLGPTIVAQKDKPVRIKFTNFLPVDGSGATGMAAITGGSITGISVSNPGSGYTTNPSVMIMGDGTGATATATVANGVVTTINVTNGGTGYTNAMIMVMGTDGNLFIPTDTSVMGAGMGPKDSTGADCDPMAMTTMCESYSQNRATLHLHGGLTPWISDGTTHQWTSPANEMTQYPKGVSVNYVPDMWYDNNGNVVPAGTPGASNNPGDGSLTFYYTNQQSARLMFYHDHAYGITRLNVYAGEAAGYLLQDPVETSLVTSGIVPADQIPLIIQDKGFVNAATLASQDPTWNWGATPGTPRTGDLWFPHVYMPNQNPADMMGVNPMGRTDYGPWFWPPFTGILHGPGLNTTLNNGGVPLSGGAASLTLTSTAGLAVGDRILIDTGALLEQLTVSSINGNIIGITTPTLNSHNDKVKIQQITNPLYDPMSMTEGPQNPGTPNPSIVPEGFMDTQVVNGTAYPFQQVGQKAYRLRILNASNDRMLNLQLYYAKSNGTMWNPDGTLNTADAGEVSMVPAIANTPGTAGYPVDITDNRDGGVPDVRTVGPDMIQIGTEGGFLPNPVVLHNTPIGYNYNRRDITVLNVSTKNLMLGPAERADVIVDFSQVPDGSKIILYNDAPAPVPAFDPRNDYYTGDPDQTVTGGAPSTIAGYGPDTRTIMQFQVTSSLGTSSAFDLNALNTAFTSTATTKGVFAADQDPIIVPQDTYNSAYHGNFPMDTNAYVRIQDNSFTFTPLGATSPITLTLGPKAIQELFDPSYGRMNATLGVELPNTTGINQTTIPLGYIDLPTEKLGAIEGNPAVPIGEAADGTQIWKITHNGVDTHAIHFHLVNVQLLNRVGWDGMVKPPDPNELGWKDTVRMNPLEDAIVAMRPIAPILPFTLPDSLRSPDVTRPATATFSSFDPLTANPITVSNAVINFGWEYVWHCHLLGHEENDMMRPLVFRPLATGPDMTAPSTISLLSPSANATGWNKAPVTVNLTASDNTGGSGIASITYSTMGATIIAPTTTVGSTTSLVIPSEGTTTVTYFASDIAGNNETAQSVVINIDLTNPTLNFGTATPVPNLAGWNNTAVTIPWTAADNLSGIATPGTSGSLLISTQGTNQTGQVTVTDVAGNSQTFTSAAVNIDLAAPTISATPNPAPNGAGWNNSPVTVNFASTDNIGGSGVSSITYSTTGATTITPTTIMSSTTAITISTEGITTITYTSTDLADNVSAPQTLTIKLDATLPTLTWGAPTPPPDASGWNNTAVDLPYTAADTGSGMATSLPASPVHFNSQGANQTQTVTVTDVAGNSQTFTSPPVNIVLTAPVVSVSSSPAPTPTGWTNGPVTLTFNATGIIGGPAVSSITYSATGATTIGNTTLSGNMATLVLSTQGITTVNYFATDSTGNSGTPQTLTVDILGIEVQLPPVIIPAPAPIPTPVPPTPTPSTGQVLGAQTFHPIVQVINTTNGAYNIKVGNKKVKMQPFSSSYKGSIYARKINFGSQLGAVYLFINSNPQTKGAIVMFDSSGKKINTYKPFGGFAVNGLNATTISESNDQVYLAVSDPKSGTTVKTFQVTNKKLINLNTLKATGTSGNILIRFRKLYTDQYGLVTMLKGKTSTVKVWRLNLTTNQFTEDKTINKKNIKI